MIPSNPLDISGNTYRITIPKRTRDSFFEAFKRYGQFHKGDFRYLIGMHKLIKRSGAKLGVSVISEALTPKLAALSAAVYGMPRRLMWPQMDTYTALMNSLRKKAFSETPSEYTVEECRMLMRICEFYSRLHIGQLQYALENLYGIHEQAYLAGHRVIEDFEMEWKVLIFNLGVGASLGVGNVNSPEEKDILFSFNQVVRHRLAWDANPEGGMTVDFDKPMNWCKSVPLSVIEKVGD